MADQEHADEQLISEYVEVFRKRLMFGKQISRCLGDQVKARHVIAEALRRIAAQLERGDPFPRGRS